MQPWQRGWQRGSQLLIYQKQQKQTTEITATALPGAGYVLLSLKHNLIFKCRKSATCTHVSGLLNAMVSMVPAQFQASPSTTDDMESLLLITSYTCKWKAPKKRKESKMKCLRSYLKTFLWSLMQKELKSYLKTLIHVP